MIVVKPPPTPPISPTSTPTHTLSLNPSIVELAKQIANLILMMQASMNPQNKRWLTEQTEPNRTETDPVRFVRVRRHIEQNRTLPLFGSCSASSVS